MSRFVASENTLVAVHANKRKYPIIFPANSNRSVATGHQAQDTQIVANVMVQYSRVVSFPKFPPAVIRRAVRYAVGLVARDKPR